MSGRVRSPTDWRTGLLVLAIRLLVIGASLVARPLLTKAT